MKAESANVDVQVSCPFPPSSCFPPYMSLKLYICVDKKQFQTGKNIHYLVRTVQVVKIAPHIIFGEKHMNTITKNFF